MRPAVPFAVAFLLPSRVLRCLGRDCRLPFNDGVCGVGLWTPLFVRDWKRFRRATPGFRTTTNLCPGQRKKHSTNGWFCTYEQVGTLYLDMSRRTYF
ncbi:hypothetical protein Bphyt_2404 [Paraburkholderia phytofirmans PsJN]|uniref:Uncharacterized protein n=1 Tax=Paraburkholderia phytofirmans (strain DSM 17436 / LMG 22146 / PsJN) TaxID=398527 RepID=B2T5D9_PARPJ|nr:hypothetical protein Bphyt_2404 [Paraburkholderia phytofirmans PsJN]